MHDSIKHTAPRRNLGYDGLGYHIKPDKVCRVESRERNIQSEKRCTYATMKSPLASLLWRSLRVYQVFGANTDVGKTIFTTLLARSAKASWKENVTFLKPISTGPADEADHRCESLHRLPFTIVPLNSLSDRIRYGIRSLK